MGGRSADHRIDLARRAPGAQGTAEKDKPTLTIWLPEKGVGTGAIVVPGGGYGGTGVDGDEGAGVARWLNSIGVAAFCVKYRQFGSGYRHPAPSDDARRALRIVRSRAEQYHLDPQRIGMVGSSAGGHLASTIATHFDAGQKDSPDPIQRVSSRPDFLVLVYPVISFTSEFTHEPSRLNLLGQTPDPQLVLNLSNEKQVTPRTPPTFIVHTNEDEEVMPENAVSFYLALRRERVPAELHVFAKGPHALGMGRNTPGFGQWPHLCGVWLKDRGLLDPPAAAAK